MRPDLAYRRSDRAAAVRAALVVLVSLAAIGLAAAAAISGNARAARSERYATQLSARTVHGVDDLVALLKAQQATYLRIAPPATDFVMRQPCGTVPFDPNGFPDGFLNGLVAGTNKGCLAYTVVVAEDPATRETVFANANGYEIHAVAPPAGYNPWWFVESAYPDLGSGKYDGAQVAWLKACYDPAHVQVTVTLLPVASIQAYAAAMADDGATASAALSGISPMMRYDGPQLTNLQFTAIETKTNGMLLTLAYPNGFTNRIDIFTCTNLVDSWWDLAATVSVSTTNWVEWLDTSPPGFRLYAAGNADLDTDHDGLADAREKFMYHTSAVTNDTDRDGLTDSNEVFNLHTDPNNSNTCPPTVTILFPTDGYGKVWLP